MKAKVLSLLAAGIFVARPAVATPIATFSATDGTRNASAAFDVSGDVLTITLTNLSSQTSYTNPFVLTGLLFHLTTPFTLTPQSAQLPVGSSFVGGACNKPGCAGSTNLAGEWGYATGAYTGGATRAIASSGYISTGLTGNRGNFGPNGTGGPDLDDPVSLNGINYGLVGAGYTNANASGTAASEPLVMSSALFTLSGATGLGGEQIDNVSFQYGTSFSEPNVTVTTEEPAPVPEPATVVLLGSGVAVLVRMQRKRARAGSQA
jgi:hypothetical protein